MLTEDVGTGFKILCGAAFRLPSGSLCATRHVGGGLARLLKTAARSGPARLRKKGVRACPSLTTSVNEWSLASYAVMSTKSDKAADSKASRHTLIQRRCFKQNHTRMYGGAPAPRGASWPRPKYMKPASLPASDIHAMASFNCYSRLLKTSTLVALFRTFHFSLLISRDTQNLIRQRPAPVSPPR